MRCPVCAAENPSSSKFCGQCGTRLPLSCPQCGTLAAPGAKFCGECGSPLAPQATSAAAMPAPSPAPPPATTPPPAPPIPPAPSPLSGSNPAFVPDGERKQVTALNAELVLPDLGDQASGHELMHRLLNRFFELATQEVGAFGGVIKQFQGRGFFALFGAPVAHEDHARRGVLAAAGLRQAIARWSDLLGPGEPSPLALQAGIDTGLVVVGGVGDMAVGATTYQAKRLRRAAAPDEVLIGAETARLVRGAVGLEPVQRPVGDRGAEETVFRVVGGAGGDDPDAVRSPFVGRKRELGVLGEVLQLAEQGHGQVVGIAGEPGAGKSRLLYELRRRLAGRPLIYLHGSCLSYSAGIPYFPFLDMVRRASSIDERDDESTVLRKLRKSLLEVGSDPERALPYFARLLDAADPAQTLADLEPHAIKARTFQAMIDMVLHASRRSLVIMELEDLHWIDATSDDFLLALIEALAASRVLLLCTYRSGFQPKWLDRSYATQLSLRRLNDTDSRTLVAAALANLPSAEVLPTDLSTEILDKAEGNPFFLEELARTLVEGRRGGNGGIAVPSTIQGVLMARIDRLPDDHKRLLQTASVLGREFTRELLAATWDRDPSALERLLLDLQSWEFVFEQPTREARYVFKHALTQDVAYDSLLLGRRQTLHKRAAEAIETLFAGRLEDAYDRLIYHYPHAQEPAKTVHYLTLFAQRAASNFSHAEAVRALREGLEHAALLPDRVRQVANLVILLAESLLPLARFPETLELLDAHVASVDALGEPSIAAKFHFWLAHTHSYMGHQDLPAEHARRSIRAAHAAGDEATEGLAYYVLGRDGFWSGRFALGAESSLRAVVLLERSGEPWWQGQAYWVAGFNFYELGQFEKAFDHVLRAQEIGRALADPRLDPTWSIGHFYASLGEWDQGIAYCQQAVLAAKDPLNGAVASGFLGHALLEKGDVAAAVGALEPALAATKNAGMRPIQAWFSAYLAEAYAASARAERALQVGEDGLRVSEATQFRYGIALAERALGIAHRAAGQQTASSDWLLRAVDSFAALETPFELGRTLLDLAATTLERGDPSARRAYLERAQTLFAQLQVPKYVEHCRQLLAV
jgi:class 3 adenylate cyclase/tetratricopeptide (TPR) repeat protein